MQEIWFNQVFFDDLKIAIHFFIRDLKKKLELVTGKVLEIRLETSGPLDGKYIL